ncbi:hypothetical protein MHY85_03025 [Cellulomonas sp. ACRRI]|uniref:hypothetical protein n=1 Tax=Cellulomonas sp. ACRRI TaxID=2918188 RepID=UPI001EF38F68|nr:hypothetical protein [Cellulomonas sp. ACRRI]MCG7284944.1 hypothetical protein [Cellulomonas sp. ACRRI]
MNAARSFDQPGPTDQVPGRIWVDEDRTVLRMSGEIDLVVVGEFRARDGRAGADRRQRRPAAV